MGQINNTKIQYFITKPKKHKNMTKFCGKLLLTQVKLV